MSNNDLRSLSELLASIGNRNPDSLAYCDRWTGYVKEGKSTEEIPQEDWDKLLHPKYFASIGRGQLSNAEKQSFKDNWNELSKSYFFRIIDKKVDYRIRLENIKEAILRIVEIIKQDKNKYTFANRTVSIFCPDILMNIASEKDVDELYTLLKPYARDRIYGEGWLDKNSSIKKYLDEELQREINYWEITEKNKKIMEIQKSFDNYIDLIKSNHNLILTGAPGTGKTYMARQIAANMIGCSVEKLGCEGYRDQFGFVQFHPSYDYTDFVEGLRPCKKTGTDNIVFERVNGVFKEFCKNAIKKAGGCNLEQAYWELCEEIKNNPDYRVRLKKGIESSQLSLSSENNIKWVNKIQQSEDTNCVSLDRLKILYKKYDTIEKIDGIKNIDKEIREIIGGCNSTYYWAILRNVVERIKPDKPFVFVIDEINRGEISKIFGELFFSIDPGYRKEKDRIPVKTQYQNLITETDPQKEPFCNGFYVPENVYIIGTMNDIDRSVENMDFAFRRRFAFEEITAEKSKQMLIGEYCEEAKKRMDSLNIEIAKTEGLGTQYQIGAAYFKKIDDVYHGNWQALWDNHIKGVLFEYLRGRPDADKILKETFGKAYFLEDSGNGSTNTEGQSS